MLSRAGKAVVKHAVLLSLGMMILGLSAYIVYDQTVNAPQMHKLEEETDFLQHVAIDEFNAHQEELLRLNLLLEHNGIKIADALIPAANAVPTW